MNTAWTTNRSSGIEMPSPGHSSAKASGKSSGVWENAPQVFPTLKTLSSVRKMDFRGWNIDQTRSKNNEANPDNIDTPTHA